MRKELRGYDPVDASILSRLTTMRRPRVKSKEMFLTTNGPAASLQRRDLDRQGSPVGFVFSSLFSPRKAKQLLSL